MDIFSFKFKSHGGEDGENKIGMVMDHGIRHL
jgi:hypothetical protein